MSATNGTLAGLERRAKIWAIHPDENKQDVLQNQGTSGDLRKLSKQVSATNRFPSQARLPDGDPISPLIPLHAFSGKSNGTTHKSIDPQLKSLRRSKTANLTPCRTKNSIRLVCEVRGTDAALLLNP